MILTVPMPANLANVAARKSRHWRTTYREKLQYWMQLDDLQRIGVIPPPPQEAYALSSISSVMFLGGAMDDDNAMARHKPLLDWLKTRGYIQDDRKKNLVWEGLPQQIVKRDGNYRIMLTLSPIETSHG